MIDLVLRERLIKRFEGVLKVALEQVQDSGRYVEIIDVSESQIKIQLMQEGTCVSSESINGIFKEKLSVALREKYPNRRYNVQDDNYIVQHFIEGGTSYYIKVSRLEECKE